MIRILDFNALRPQDILNRDIRAEEDVSAAVDAILADVRQNGDAALLRYAEKFNGVKLDRLEVTPEEWDAALEVLDGTGLSDGYVQELSASGEEEIPAFDGTGVIS